MEVLQLSILPKNPSLFAILQKGQSLMLRHLGKAVWRFFKQTRDFSEESNLCNTCKITRYDARLAG
jgi:hypothetical protein